MIGMKIALSGAITGVLAESKEYFARVEAAVRKRYPLAEVFNPRNIPESLSWESAMTICRARLNGWATHIVYIENEHYAKSRGSREEKEIAQRRKLVELVTRDYDTIEEA